MPPRPTNPVSAILSALTLAVLVALAFGVRPKTRGRRAAIPASAPAVAQAGRPRTDSTVDRILDEVGLYGGTEERSEQWLGRLYEELGVDLRVMILRETPGGDIEAYATRTMRDHGVGRSTSGRGILVVYDSTNGRLRIEVGPGLDDIVTDAFVGYLTRENTAALFAERGRSPELGIRTTIFMLHRRLRDAAIGKAYDPAAVTFVRNPARIAAGAGVTRSAAPGGDSSAFLRDRTYPEDLIRFSEQPTVADAYYREVDWLREGNFQKHVPLFTPETQAFWDRYQVMTRAWADYLLMGRYGQQFVVYERGDLALLVFTTTPFESPQHYRRNPKGWQYDVMADIRNTKEWIAYPYTWTMVDTDDDFSRTFKDLWVKKGSAWRITGGDNRRLPQYWHRADSLYKSRAAAQR